MVYHDKRRTSTLRHCNTGEYRVLICAGLGLPNVEQKEYGERTDSAAFEDSTADGRVGHVLSALRHVSGIPWEGLQVVERKPD